MVPRRAVLRSVGIGSLVAIAGCLGRTPSSTSVEFSIINNRGEPEIVDLSVRDEDDISVLTHSIEVNPVSRGRGGESWKPELTISEIFLVNEEYQFTAEVADSEFAGDSEAKTVTADCTAGKEEVGGSWWVRLHSGGGVTIYDNDIC